MATALFVERDPAYVVVQRPLRGTMTAEEWHVPAHRIASIEAHWKLAIDGKRSEDEFFTAPWPVTLYYDPSNAGAVAFADIRAPKALRPVLITPQGRRILVAPDPPPGGWIVAHTTYLRWAEGPLPHIDPSLDETAPTTKDDIAIQRLRAQNSALRELVDRMLAAGANDAAMPRTVEFKGLVDFRIRGVFHRRDYRVLVSKQPGGDSKIITSEGLVE